MSIWNADEWNTVRINPSRTQLKTALKRLEGRNYPYNSTGSYDFPDNPNLTVAWGLRGSENQIGQYSIQEYGKKSIHGLTVDEVVAQVRPITVLEILVIGLFAITGASLFFVCTQSASSNDPPSLIHKETKTIVEVLSK